jgi:Cofactor assembly of complex C subunit B, CCB2/CCB4
MVNFISERQGRSKSLEWQNILFFVALSQFLWIGQGQSFAVFSSGKRAPTPASTASRQHGYFFPLSETGNEDFEMKTKIRFTADFLNKNDNSGIYYTREDEGMDENLLDMVISTVTSDAVSIVLGLIGLLWVVIHRFTLLDVDSAEALTIQTRTDLLTVLACGSVLLNGATKLDVTALAADAVALDGTALEDPEVQYRISDSLDENIDLDEVKRTLSWTLKSLLTASPAKTAVLLQRNVNSIDGSNPWTVTCRAGILPIAASAPNSTVPLPDKTPILDRVGTPGNVKETYLPTLQALPGRFEFFSYLPANTQLALLIPIAHQGVGNSQDQYNDVLVLGSNTAKSFVPRDIAWSRVVADCISRTT